MSEDTTLLMGGVAGGGAPLPGQETVDRADEAPVITVNSDGSFPDGWNKGLGEGYEGLSKFKTVEALAKSYRHLEGRSVHYPTQESTPEQVQLFRSLAGVPDDASGYDLKAPDKMPDGVVWDEALAQRYAQVAHEYHVPKAALQALAAEQVSIEAERQAQAVAAQAKKLSDDSEALRKEWGADTEARLSTARVVFGRLAAAVGLDVNSQDGIALQNNPAFVRMAYAMSKYMAEDKLAGAPKERHLMGGAEQAQDIINNRDNPYFERYWQGDLAVQAMVRQLLGGH